MVMAQSLFISLKQQYKCSISVLAMDWSRPLLNRMPEVDEIYSMPIGHGELALGKRYQIARQLAKKTFDWAIVLPNSLKSALIPWWAKISRRTGWRGEFRYGLLNDMRLLDKRQYPLMVQRFVALGGAVGQITEQYPLPQLKIDLESQQQALERLGLSTSTPMAALCPGAEFGPSKKWPARSYANVAERLISEGLQIWVFGSQNDAEVAQQIQSYLDQRSKQQFIDLTGHTSLAEAIDLLGLAQLVLTNDSGLMHVAASLSRPLVAVYGSTSPDFTPPLGEQSTTVQNQIECAPCFERQCPLGHHRCMTDLSVDQVWAHLHPLLHADA
ncbi:MAG TPA: lipopolysaccharide heptosyltransferase II [Gammaproteobacteria bacterium]|nr:lipopolysaccharide heptosyltransferase II [Gammaproteobacteria bacterium]